MRGAPQSGVLTLIRQDQDAQLGVDPRSGLLTTAISNAIVPKADPMPTHEGLGFAGLMETSGTAG